MNILDAILRDPNLSPAFRRAATPVTSPELERAIDDLGALMAPRIERMPEPRPEPVREQHNLLIRRAAVARERRFSDDSITGFGSINEIGSQRWRDVRDEEYALQLREQDIERDERGD